MPKKNELDVTEQSGALLAFTPERSQELLKSAIEQGGVEAIERIVALIERGQDKEAARAFHAAMRQFSAEMEPIPKKRDGGKTSRGGSSFSYKYAPLEDIARAIRGPLQAAGLSYTWDSEDNGETVTTICTVRHIDGHAQSARFTCPTAASTGMNEQHKRGTALSYGRRYSLIQALGLTACDEDDDCGDPGPFETITEDQAATLEDWIENVGADKAKFLLWAGVGALADLPQSRYDAAVAMLKKKGGRG